MREASIICPINDNQGRLRRIVVSIVRDKLIDAFGGCTVHNAEGYWRDASGKLIMDNVKVFTVACQDGAKDGEAIFDAYWQLNEIADYIGLALKQDAVYVRYPNGEVHNRDTKHLHVSIKDVDHGAQSS